MFVEERIYTLHPGKLSAFLRLYEEKGFAPQREILGSPVGWYVSEMGELNQVVHLWAYDSLDDRDARRRRLMDNEQFKEYLAAMFPLLQKMENRLLRPAPFFVEPLQRIRASAAGQ